MSHSYVTRPSGVTTRPSAPSSPWSSETTAGLSGMATMTPRAWTGLGRDGLFDRPGVPRLQELRDVPRALFGDRPLLLIDDDLLIDGRRDGREHPDRHRVVG